MPGTVIRALSKTRYDFSSIPLSTSTSLFVARAIDVSQYRFVEFVPRIHALSIVGAGSNPSIVFSAMADAPTPDDPQLEFYTAAVGTSAVPFNSMTPSTVAPLAPQFSIRCTPPYGPFLRFQIQATQSGTAATTFWVVCSIDVIAKC